MPAKRRHLVRVSVIVVLVVAAALQAVPVDRSNPAVTGTIPAPPDVEAILRRSCFDCHSNETSWPWYSYVAPVSWLISGDVHDGREAMNFSEWDRYPPKEQAHLVEEIDEETTDGDMPPGTYLALHRGAALSDADRQRLAAWAQQVGGGSRSHGARDDDD